MKQKIARGILGAAVAVLAFEPATSAFATEGYFQHGYGARQKALAGAGVADGRDATAASLNPAGIVHADNELDVALSIFSPRREMKGSGPAGFTPTGTVESDNEFFPVPNIARNWRLHGHPLFDAVALTMYGNGGMNTEYGTNTVSGCGAGAGVFCAGRAGVNLQQMFLSVAGAKKFGNVSVGVAPIFAMQMFEAKGLAAFSTASSDSANLSGRDTDVSFGGGLRAGIEWSVLPNLRLGLAGSTPIWMQRFDRYSGLFAEQGGFDIPASLQAGVALDVTPAVTVMADYKRIWYGSVPSIANPSPNFLTGGLLGLDNGSGFGWKDIDIVKIGVEWRTSPNLTLRAGYAYNTQPIPSRDVMFNILAPGVVQHHITGGLQYRLSRNLDLELAAMYAPHTTVTGNELAFGGPSNAAHQIEIGMHQLEVTAGIKYRFGAEAPLK
ncbi:MAG: hydrocarbon degradation protein [Hyphomicrobiaceae bacterium]|nr:MAG: hydrocarbon degradation protein [Hyphomicrobiaceae bacterium]